MNRKLWIIFIVIAISMLVGYSFIIAKHIDYLLNKKSTSATLISQREGKDGDGKYLIINYFNDYCQHEIKDSFFVKYEDLNFPKDQLDFLSSTDLIYTKWIKQYYIKNSNEPANTILIFDFIFLSLLYLAFKAGITGLRKNADFS